MKFRFYHLSILCFIVLVACQTTKKDHSKFILNGYIEGMGNGKVLLDCFHFDGRTTDTALIKAGVFQFKGDIPVPVQSTLLIEGDGVNGRISLYCENSKISVKANVADIRGAEIIGSKSNDDYLKYKEMTKLLVEKNRKNFKEYTSKGKDATPEDLKRFNEGMEQYKDETILLRKKYIKENPTAHYAAVLALSDARGKGAEELEAILKGLHPAMKENPLVKSMYDRLEKMNRLEVGIDKIMGNASNVRYKVDAGFNGDKLLDVVYLSILPNNNVCALQADGNILMITPEGKEINRFKPELKGKASAIAIDNHEQIYVLSGLMKKEKTKVRGKIYEQDKENGVLCTILSKEGHQIDQFQLGGVVTATGTRIIDNKLIVSDCKTGKIAIFDAKTGKAQTQIGNMRPCCGILDFSVNDNKEILVANLGAFRVQAYDMNGKNIVTFGQRGKSLDDFHGCCNPVSVAYLSSGAIVTVEKDPTRIKIYSKEGAKQIEGIEELVHGCSYIPMTVDSDDNLYLASGSKGMVKCIPVN